MNMERKTTVTVAPMVVPDKVFYSVTLEGSVKTVFQELPLEKVDSETLHKLCDEFRENVFKKAKKPLTVED